MRWFKIRKFGRLKRGSAVSQLEARNKDGFVLISEAFGMLRYFKAHAALAHLYIADIL